MDGKETGYGDPDLSRQSTWTTKPSGKGDAKVEIYIDGTVYRTYDVNFDNGTVVETTDMQALGEFLSSKEDESGEPSGEANDQRDDGYREPSEDDD